ncbi:MAG: translation initiation factor IF-2 [Prevotellaceae bacterium]|jgi:translation initiation factor IF-2|nr:translation initiation factor IF-2 [Prevotellaceae bacterium]
MTNSKEVRISKVVKEFNIGIATLVDFLKKKGIDVEANPNAKISGEAYALAAKEFGKELNLKEASKKVNIKPIRDIQNLSSSVSDKKQTIEEPEIEEEPEIIIKTNTVEIKEPKIIGKIDLDEIGGKAKAQTNKNKKNQETENTVDEPETGRETKQVHNNNSKDNENSPVENIAEKTDDISEAASGQQEEPTTIQTVVEPLEGPKVVGKITIEEPRPIIKKKEKEQRKSDKKTDNNTEKTKTTGTIDKSTIQESIDQKEKNQKEEMVEQKPQDEFIPTKIEKLSGPNVVGKIDLQQFNTKKSGGENSEENKRKRKRIKKDKKVNIANPGITSDKSASPNKPIIKPVLNKDKNANKKQKKGERFKPVHQAVDEEAVQKQVKETLARLTSGKGKTKSSKYRREKRDAASQRNLEEMERQEMESNILDVTEFVTVNELATMMDVPVTQVIEACMNLGLMVSINQRLDAEALVLVAEEFGYRINFVSVDIQDAVRPDNDDEKDLFPRPPIVTVMGHVDHGKTSLLDYVRNANVIAGEAGGITQHIGAYNVKLSNDRRITFLDTPGHEAFTAMRARGAKITDMAIIIVAADDAVMPQTVEAINHAVAAGVPMIFAINKIDKDGANPEKIREQLANMNYLVEEWGGKYQSQEISAKKGLNVDKLLDKVLLEADILDLKANPNKRAFGTVIESSLDKGRGYITTLLVQGGTLRVGDIVLSGSYTGRVKAMSNERGQRITEAGPSTPVLMLGLNGAPTAGETFNVMEDEKESREIANKREQLLRMQSLRTQKHITLDEIGRRIAIGNFKELNIVLKGDVDGSIEALSDSLIKLSTEEVQVNVIHKAVGAISESDILLAAASNAIIIGFQVRPSSSARKLAEKEEIEIRLYSVIYDAINEVKDGIEGMLAPEVKEEITATVEVLETFKITKVGTVAGCIVREGKINRNAKIRVIRGGIVVYTGTLGSLKRFKDDVKEVGIGYDCGLNVENYNDIKVGDIIEAYDTVEIKRKL